jgi:hypothetical protein
MTVDVSVSECVCSLSFLSGSGSIQFMKVFINICKCLNISARLLLGGGKGGGGQLTIHLEPCSSQFALLCYKLRLWSRVNKSSMLRNVVS